LCSIDGTLKLIILVKYLMIDLVTNHFGYSGDAYTVDYSTFNPFNTKDDFHPVCFIYDYNNQTQLEDVSFPSGFV